MYTERTSSLIPKTSTSLPHLENQLTGIDRRSIMMAHINTEGAWNLLPMPRTGNSGAGAPYLPINISPDPSRSSTRMNTASSLPYTAFENRKMSSRAVTGPANSATTLVSPNHNSRMPVTVNRERPLETSSSVSRSPTPLDNSPSAPPSSQSTDKPCNMLTANALVVSNDESPSKFARCNTGNKDVAAVVIREQPRTATTLVAPSRRRHVVVDDDDDDDEDEDEFEDRHNIPTPSTALAMHISTRERSHSHPRISSSSPQTSSARNSEDHIPSPLRGVKMAMGEANWMEYIGLTESYVNGEVSEQEFGTGTSTLFRVEDERMRSKIRRLMYRMVHGSRER